MEKVAIELGVGEEVGVMHAQILARDHQKAAGSGRWIADDVLRRRRGHLHHELDDVARRAELAVLAGARELAQHVLVDVALGVAVVHGDVVDEVDHLGEQSRSGDGEAGVAHVVGVGRAVAQGAEEGKDMVGETLELLIQRGVLETLPAKLFVGKALLILALGMRRSTGLPSRAALRSWSSCTSSSRLRKRR